MRQHLGKMIFLILSRLLFGHHNASVYPVPKASIIPGLEIPASSTNWYAIVARRRFRQVTVTIL